MFRDPRLKSLQIVNIEVIGLSYNYPMLRLITHDNRDTRQGEVLALFLAFALLASTIQSYYPVGKIQQLSPLATKNMGSLNCPGLCYTQSS